MACVIAARLLLAPAPARAQQPSGEVESHECCSELLMPIGARAVALGNTMGARPTVDGVFDNPASLAPMDSGAFVIHHVAGSLAQSDAFSLLMAPQGIGTFGLSYLLVDYGDIASTDATGRQIGSISIRTHVLVGSFATSVGAHASAGLNYVLYLSRVHCSGQCAGSDVSASTQSVDLGARYAPPLIPDLQLGITLAHLGLPLQVNNAAQADPPPTRLHLSAAYDVLRRFPRMDPALSLWLTGELVTRWPSFGAPTPAFGVEFAAADAIFLRAGYATGTGLGTGPSVGVGLNYERFKIALAKTFTTSSLQADQTPPVQVTFQIRF